MSPEELLRVQDLTLTVPAPGGPVAVVDRLSFSIARGEALALLGESGCGKTLTALALLRLLPPAVRWSGGRVIFAGTDLTELSERRLRPYRGGRMAMVFQEPMTALNPVLRAGFQVEEVLEVHRNLTRRERKAEVVRLLGSVGLPDPESVARRYPHELSGGMRQRVLLAMALAGEPELLIADEPTTALDVTVQAQVLELLGELRARTGLAVLWVTHDLGVVAETCERALVMYAGRLAESAPIGALFRAPAHPYTRGLLAALPRLDRRDPPRGVAGRVPPPEAFPEGCRFRDRCGEAGEDCRREPPAERVGSAHFSHCWRSAPQRASEDVAAP